MRVHTILFLLLFSTSAFGAPQSDDSLPSAEVVVARLLEHNSQRQAQAAGYTGMRLYALQNEHLHRSAQMLVRVECDEHQEKHFTLVSEQGWKAAEKHVLHKMLESEAEASLPSMRSKSELNPDNYEFHMVRAALSGDRMEYVLDVVPRRHEERLFEGQIWVDAHDYALTRVEGHPARNPSFWIRSVHFVQTYQKAGPLWFPNSTDSITKVRLLGATTLTINYFDYVPNALPAPNAMPKTNALPETQSARAVLQEGVTR